MKLFVALSYKVNQSGDKNNIRVNPDATKANLNAMTDVKAQGYAIMSL